MGVECALNVKAQLAVGVRALERTRDRWAGVCWLHLSVKATRVHPEPCSHTVALAAGRGQKLLQETPSSEIAFLPKLPSVRRLALGAGRRDRVS